MADRNLLSNLIAKTSTIIFDEKTEMPAVPRLGQLWYKEGILYIYSTIGGINLWSPLNVRNKSYVHTQISDDVTWTINHNLNDDDIIYAIYDENNRLITSSDVTITANTLTLEFLESERGKCIVFAVGHSGGTGGSNAPTVSWIKVPAGPVSMTYSNDLLSEAIYAKDNERYKLTYSYISDTLDSVIYNYSSDSGSTYTEVGTESFNYNISGYITSVDWTAV